MRQWRVGTLSMGLLLIFSGIGLLWAQFNKVVVIDFSLTWWPVIFICLGLEVLALNYFNRAENPRLKYDFASVLVTLVILSAGLGLHACTQAGLVAEARTIISSRIFEIPLSTEIPLEAGIERVVLATGGNQVRIHSSQGSSILADCTFEIRALSQTEAQETAAQCKTVPPRRVENTLYIDLHTMHGSRPFMDCSHDLIIPDYINLEIDGEGSSLDINLASLQSDWEINSSGVCTLKLPAVADITINAVVDNESALHGNLAWTTAKIFPAGQPTADKEAAGASQVQACSKLGNGSHQINLLGMNDVTVNYLP